MANHGGRHWAPPVFNMSRSVTAYGSFCCTARIWIHFHLCFPYLPSLNLYSLINFDFIWHLPHCWVLTPRYIHKFSLFSSASKETYITENIVLRSYWLYVLLFDLARKQCNGIITVSLSEMSESERRFLVNNILMFRSVLCLVTSHLCLKLPTHHHPAWKETSYVYYT